MHALKDLGKISERKSSDMPERPPKELGAKDLRSQSQGAPESVKRQPATKKLFLQHG
jgi:hypothetical protein